MGIHSLIVFLGTEDSGLYQYASIFRKMGISCGMPYAFLRSTLAAKRMPSHEFHSYFSAIRRFFGDLGLPPIAEVPPDRLGSSQFEYYSSIVCRCLLTRLKKTPYLCADHLGALALPIFLRAAVLGEFRYKNFLFFNNPENEAATLLTKYGQPAKLSEFIWRNTIVSAIRHCGENLFFIDTENMSIGMVYDLKNEILDFCGMPRVKTDIQVPIITNDVSPQGPIKLSSTTMDLYKALKRYINNKDFAPLESLAQNAFLLQSEQNGWQYFDCLDCGELDAHARLLLNENGAGQYSYLPAGDDYFSSSLAVSKDLPAFLDSVERKLVMAQNDYAGKLFLHTSTLSTYYAHKLDDTLTVALQEKKPQDTRLSCRKKIRHVAQRGKPGTKRK